MRNLIIASAIALAASTAAANPFAEVENQGGGKITLLTDTCQAKPQLSRAYFYTSIGVTEDGCWSYDGDTIVVEWQQQGRRRYPISAFRLLNQFSKFRSW